MVAQGLLLTPNAYLKSGWNRLDAFIVLVSLLDYLSALVPAFGGPPPRQMDPETDAPRRK